MKKSYLICTMSVFLLASVMWGEETRLTYDVVKTMEKGPVESRPPIPKVTKEILTIGLNPNTIFLETNDNKKIFDFTEKRVTNLLLKEKRYESFPLVAIIDFHISELLNCMKLKEAVAAFGEKTANMFDSQFDMENVFSVEFPDKEVREKVGQVKKVLKGKEVNFDYGGKTIVKFVPSSHLVPKELEASFRRMLIYVMPMHPQIRREIQKINMFPETLYVRASHGMVVVTEWKLKTFSQNNKNSCDIPETFKLSVDKNISLKEVLNLSKTSKKQTKEQMTQQVEKFIEDKKNLDAVLAIYEYGFQESDMLPRECFVVFREDGRDELTSQMFSLQGKNKPSPQVAIELLDKLRKQKLAKGYVLDVFKANWLTDLKKNEQAKQLLLNVLKKNPHLVGVYNDLGHLYRRGYDMQSAWVCWNIALQINPSHQMLAPIKEMKKQLIKNFPDFF